MSKKPEISLRVRAMRYLARREYSRAELHARLLTYATAEDNVDAVLDELVKRGWQSDERAATQMVHAKRSRFGAQRITHELRQKGIAEEMISAALPELKESELEAAREVWEKKFGVAPRGEKEKARQMRFMQSRGFGLDVVFKVLQRKGE
ncbi:MAG: recombination regulator RecX [Gallionellaceae bacterium]|nr:recombination regulator RecX [Gallionellaceae bacterium]